MHQRQPKHLHQRTSTHTRDGQPLWMRLAKRLAQVGAVVGAGVVVVNAVGDKEPAPPSASIVAAEASTRAFLDERAAHHLRQLRR